MCTPFGGAVLAHGGLSMGLFIMEWDELRLAEWNGNEAPRLSLYRRIKSTKKGKSD